MKKRYEDYKKQERQLWSEIENLEKHSSMDQKEKKKMLRALA